MTFAATDAVLLLAHGTIREPAEMAEFLTSVRRGRPAPAALVTEMVERYAKIGGSPLLRISQAQADAVASSLGVRCDIAMRLWHPSVEERLIALASAGVRRVCLLPLAPFSVDVYLQAARAAQATLSGPARELELVAVPGFAEHPAFIEAHSELIRRHLPAWQGALVLTAHSLPLQVIRGGDRYAIEVQRAKAAIDARLGLSSTLAYQSQGAEGGEWLGPTLRDVLTSLAGAGETHVTLAPFGFLSDHVETLYDLDIEAKDWGRELGLTLTRVPALNDDPRFIACLCDLARKALRA